MPKILIVGDLHIDEKSIPEIEDIFNKDIFPIEADTLIQLGDYYHSNFPSAAELRFGTALAKKLVNTYKEVIVLSGTGEHDLCRGSSIIEYLAEVGVKTVKGDYTYNNNLFGHWMVNESSHAFGTGKCNTASLDNYKYVFLGHQHIPQNVSTTVFHLGSIRYVSFGEVEGPTKRFAVIDEIQDTFDFFPIKHNIPMYDVYSLYDLTNLEDKSKVRLIYKDFNVYKKEAAEANRAGKRFKEFKIKLDFQTPVTAMLTQTELVNKEELIQKYLEGITDKEVRKLIEDNL